MIEIIKKKIGLLPTYILGTDKELQGKYFNILLFFSSLFSSISCVFNFLESTNLALNISNLFCSLVIIILYYLSRFKNYHNMWITVITILAFQSLFWFMNAGSIGSVTYIYILALMFFVIIAKRNDQNKILYIFIINISGLYILEYFFGDKIIIPYSDKYNQYSDMVFVFLLVLFWVFFLSRFIKRSYDDEKELVNKQKLIIEDKNKELLSSLSYASDLQKKIISNGSKLNVLFEDSFVLFKPKDIVSGDFYWLEKKENTILFAVADCTGHGVPGAFMSIIGSNALNQVVVEKISSQPGKMLNNLNKILSETLKQHINHTKLKDGMDIALCSLNLQTLELQYAGAHNPLLVVRAKEFIEIKANNTTIGTYEPDNIETYQNHIVQLQKGDTIYIFSDGYVDQYGGPESKKFGLEQFRNMLSNINTIPLDEQKQILAASIDKWRGDTEQVDDILIMGVRV